MKLARGAGHLQVLSGALGWLSLCRRPRGTQPSRLWDHAVSFLGQQQPGAQLFLIKGLRLPSLSSRVTDQRSAAFRNLGKPFLFLSPCLGLFCKGSDLTGFTRKPDLHSDRL